MCSHEHFSAHVVVNRLEDIGAFAADVSIRCIDCGVPFEFVGIPGGISLERPTTSVDRTEARMPIVPREV